jgi:N6-adenosine-specific RNA methylase IME4
VTASGLYRTIVADPPWPHNDGPLGRQRELAAGTTPERVAVAAFLTYPTLTVDEITALPIGDLAAPGAHLYLWTTNRFLWDAPRVFHAWGFAPSTTISWCKEPMGLGGGSEAFANTTEFVVWGRKRFGQAIREARERLGLKQGDVWDAVRARHGGRPTGLVALWEADKAWPSPGDLPYLCDLFGWDSDDFAGAPSKRWSSTWFSWKRGAHSAKPEAFLDLVEQTSPGPYLELFARRARLGWDTYGDEALHGTEAVA